MPAKQTAPLKVIAPTLSIGWLSASSQGGKNSGERVEANSYKSYTFTLPVSLDGKTTLSTQGSAIGAIYRIYCSTAANQTTFTVVVNNGDSVYHNIGASYLIVAA